tara:strand:- start:74 stop:430 length:357 start_codon:yes stop_codon:yes gene_type:complete
MTSTRNNNTKGNYCLQQQSYQKGASYNLNPSKRIAYFPALPCPGVNIGQMPNTVLSKNPTDIESLLFGINSNNLEKKQKKVHPNLNYLESLSFYPRLQPYLPEPLIIENKQRPIIFRR